jgi:hypothetical protein
MNYSKNANLLMTAVLIVLPVASLAENLTCDGTLASDKKTTYEINIDMDKPRIKSTIRYVLPDGSTFSQGLGIDKRIFSGGKTRYVDSFGPEKYLEVEAKGGRIVSAIFNHALSGFNATPVLCVTADSIPEKPSCGSKEQVNSQFIDAIRYSNNLDTIRSLIECGGDASLQNKTGCTPLMYALDASCGVSGSPVHGPGGGVTGKTTEIVDLLLNSGAVADTVDSQGETALIKAAKYNVTGVYDSFIAAEANFDIQDKNGYTALMYAVEAGNVSNVIDILSANPDRTLKNKRGQTAYAIAKQWQKTQIAELVQSAGTKVMVMAGADGACSPLSIDVKQGQPVELSLMAGGQMLTLQSKALKIDLMAGPGSTVKQVFTPTAKGQFEFTCGLHGSTNPSKGTITVQ